MPRQLSQPAPRILVVDDEPHVRKFVRLSLQAEGFNVLEAATAEEAITLVYTANPSLMILDLGLPDIDGQQVIRDVRLTSNLPILVLTGRAEDSEKIASLEQGADDYMRKPFVIRDLIDRVRNALAQHEARKNGNNIGSMHTGSLHIQLRAPEVTRDEERVPLEAEEYALLRLLALHGGRVLTYRAIERTLWGRDDRAAEHKTLQRYVRGLRQKLEAQPSFPRYIVTESAIGYRLELHPPEKLASSQ